MTDSAASRNELKGWKAIADYLNVAVRTAQNLEEERGLPVRRGAGRKAPVYALVTELEQWQRAQHGPEDAIPRRHVMLPVIAASGAMFAAAVYGFGRWRRLHLRPTGWRINGNTLTVLGDGGRELWHHTFPTELADELYTDRTRFGETRCEFADLDGDGHLETLFQLWPANLNAGEPKLMCFSPDGNIRWKFSTNRSVVDVQSHEWMPPYLLNNFAVISGTPARVVATSNHFFSFPSQVAVLDPSANVVSEFWHRGHLTHVGIADLNGDGRTELLLGGVNDAPEYNQATLLVFDPNAIAGASSSPAGDRYFKGFGVGTEVAEIFFPRTTVSLLQEFNRVSGVLVGTRRIVVIVSEGIVDLSPLNVIYEMDFQFNTMSVVFSDDLKARYRELETNGTIPRGSLARDEARLRVDVKVLRRRRMP
jgi:hypothetical protein